MTTLVGFLNFIQKVILWLAALALLILPLITFYDVVMRYVFSAPTIWVTEISIYLLKFIVFTTVGALVVDGAHLRVSFLIEKLKGRSRAVLELVTTLVILPYSFVLVWYGWYYVSRALAQGAVSPTLLQVPMWFVYSLIPAGGILLMLAVAAKSISDIQDIRAGGERV